MQQERREAVGASTIAAAAAACAGLSACDAIVDRAIRSGTTSPASRHWRNMRLWCGGSVAMNSADAAPPASRMRSKSARAAGARASRGGRSRSASSVRRSAASVSRALPVDSGGTASASASPERLLVVRRDEAGDIEHVVRQRDARDDVADRLQLLGRDLAFRDDVGDDADQAARAEWRAYDAAACNRESFRNPVVERAARWRPEALRVQSGIAVPAGAHQVCATAKL